MALLNPRFQEAGAAPGEAAHWSLVALSRRERIAAFAVGAPRGEEHTEGPILATPTHLAFEGFAWSSWLGVWEQVGFARAPFGPEASPVEGWVELGYLAAWRDAQTEAASFSGDEGLSLSQETFEARWMHTPWASDWASVSTQPARFEAEHGELPREAFEAGWRRNQAFLRAWSEADGEHAYFDEGVRLAELFGADWSATHTL